MNRANWSRNIVQSKCVVYISPVETKVNEATSFVDVCVCVCAPRAHNIGVLVKRLATFETKASKKQATFNAKTGFSNVTLQFLHVFHSAGFFLFQFP